MWSSRKPAGAISEQTVKGARSTDGTDEKRCFPTYAEAFRTEIGL